MYNKSLLLLVLSGCITLCVAYHGADLPKGPYCGINGRCCKDRHDGCYHEIFGSRCYCDQFCNRSATYGHDDCCPDFEEVCLGQIPVTTTEAPPEEYRQGYIPGDTIQRGCNTCVYRYPDLPESDYWECERDPCIISYEVLQRVNNDRLGWRADNYTQFYDKKLKDGIVYKLGTLPKSQLSLRLKAIRNDKHLPYPSHFDSRKRWPKYISPVRDQGWCGSDWAISIASIASDRLAIQSNGAEVIVLSPQTLVSCNTINHQKACFGGDITSGWVFVTRYGLLDEDCFPYNTSEPLCPSRFKRGNLISNGCKPDVPLRTTRYKVRLPNRLVEEHDIMYDIMESGPVQAVMTVYQDFFHYRDGIYRRSNYGNNNYKGLHSVRIIGWGELNGQKYWTVANSWGQEWGEGGYFRIVRGENESGIESFVLSAVIRQI